MPGLTALPSPSEFFWTHLGRHLIADPEGESFEDKASSALNRTYPHVLPDRERMLNKLRDIETGRSKEPLEKWAAFCATYQAGHALLAEAPSPIADAKARALLAEACAAIVAGAVAGKGKKPARIRDALPRVRLTTAMLMVVRADQPSLFVASAQPAAPGAIEHHTCGVRPYRDYIRDLLREPPDGPFVFHEFDKTATAPGDLVLNLSPRQIRTRGGAIDRARVLDALPLVEGQDWAVVDQLAVLVDRRERDVAAIRTVDAAIDKCAAALSVDVFDLIDALPPRGSPSWNALRLLADQTAAPAVEEADAA